jgi:replicative DNA helicase
MGEVVRFQRTEAKPDGLVPHDLDAERAVLSACMLDGTAHRDGTPNANAIAADVLAADGAAAFFDLANGRVWQAIQAVHASHTPVDLITVAAWLRDRSMLEKVGGTEYLAHLCDATPAVGNVEAHARIVLERHEDRKLIAACHRIAAEGRQIPGDRATWRADVRQELGRLTAPRVRLIGASVGVAVREARAHVQDVLDGRVVGVRWGFPAIEDLVGLLARGRQHVLAGRSEHGKTALAFQVATNVASAPLVRLGDVEIGEAVYVMSGEMKRRDLVFRGACSLARVDARRIEMGLATWDEIHDVGKWFDWLERLPMIIDDQPAGPTEIASRVRAHRAEFEAGRARDAAGNLYPRCRLQLVIGDHLQRLAATVSSPVRDKFERIAATSNGWLTEIAKGCDVATLLLSQMSRGLEDGASKGSKGVRWPRKNDLYGATEIEADADTILAVHRPELIDDECSDEWRGLAGLVRLKSRFGGTNKIARLGFDGGFFYERAQADA